MKGLVKKLGLCFLAGTSVVAFASCADNDNKPVETEAQVQEAKTKALADLKAKFDAIDQNSYEAETYETISQIYEYGVLFINGSSTVAAVNDSFKTVSTKFDEYLNSTVKLANGVFSYVASSYVDRAEILGVLEKYAVDNGLTGITLFEDSGWVLYDPNVTKGTNNYIPGYGFGAISEGRITADLAGETKTEWKRYYHDYEASDPKAIYYGDDKGSVVGDLAPYIFGTYYGTRMNETKDGYEWFPDLAKSKPQAVNASATTGLASKYRIEVTVGTELKYSTLSTKFASYNNREVELEDYITPYKLLHTKANGFARGAENLEGASGIKGMAAYYNASGNGVSEEAFANVGIKAVEEGGKAYLEIEFNQPCTQFYAMYYTSSSMYAPVPQDFIDDIGGPSAYGKFNTAAGTTPVDTTLSTGRYILESWEADKQIVFKKNANTDDGKTYQIEGLHFNILAAVTSNPEAAFNEFMAGKLHACTIPSTKLSEYKNDPRASKTVGSTTTKLNVNTCTQDEWIKLFGVNGTVAQTEVNNYWTVEPALSNEKFVSALSYSIDRVKYAENVGRTASVNYFGAAYLADPEKGIVYNSTDYHKNAVKSLLEGTDGYGYSLEKARSYFKQACAEMLSSGAYQVGDTIELEIAWQSASNVTVYHDAIKQYWEDAFNDPSVCNNQLKLNVVSYVPAEWSDVYYKKMMVGQFDIGFGGISGNPLNPLNFMEVLKSDNSSGFTLNWGPDTNEVSKDLIWKDCAWSFDALWQAAETGGYFNKGLYVKNHDSELASNGVKLNSDGTATVSIKTNKLNGIDNVTISVTKAMIFSYFNVEGSAVYSEEVVATTYDEATDILTITLTADQYSKYSNCLAQSHGYPLGIDVYFSNDILGIVSENLDSVSFEFPTA